MKEYIINNKKYRLNLFDKLDKKDAYLIGYLAGDGNYNKKTHKKLEKIATSSTNKEIIYWIRDNYCPDATISSIIPVNKKRNIVTTNYSYRISLSSKFSPIFNKYGILGLKKDRTLVNVSKDNFKYYLRGLIDADGHFSSGIRKDRNRIWVNFGITHQSHNLLNSIQNYLHNNLNISSSVRPRKDENCLDLKISNRESVKKLINWLYNDLETPCYKLEQANKFLSLYDNA